MTLNEMTTTRHELEDAVNNPEKLENGLPEDGAHGTGQSSEVNPDIMTAVLHEMRAPLHSISGFARLMLDEDVTDAATRKEFLSIVVQQSENMTQLLDELSGRLEPDDENPAADVADETA
jgi:signal transduction histidine kinase